MPSQHGISALISLLHLPLLAFSLNWNRLPAPLAAFLRMLPGPLLLLVYILWKRTPRSIRKGLELELAGRPAEAMDYCTKALNSGHDFSPGDCALLMGCLGRALLDLGRYQESEQILVEALRIGDPTGTCRASIAELFLRQGIEPERVLHLTREVINEQVREAARIMGGCRPGSWGRILAPNVALRSALWAQMAWALAILGREQEARHAIVEALQLSIKPDGDPSASYWILVSRLQWQRVANTYWLAGMAMLTLGGTREATEHFQQGDSVDREGKYGALCKKQLALLGTPLGNGI